MGKFSELDIHTKELAALRDHLDQKKKKEQQLKQTHITKEKTFVKNKDNKK